MLTPNQMSQIRRIINSHMKIIMKLTVGRGNPDSRLMESLGIPKDTPDLITSSYLYGKAGMISDQKLDGMTEQQIDKLLSEIGVTKAERSSIQALRNKVSLYLDRIKQTLTTSVMTSAIDLDLQLWNTVRDVIPNAVAQRNTIQQTASKLRDSSGDMFRDWHRVAQTEMWGAKCQGEVDTIMNGESPLSKSKGETLVYMKPAPDACAKCKQLFLMPDGVTPRVFTLSQLMANGTNNGRRQTEWLAVVPPVHPNCRCTLNVMPPGTEFDQQGNLRLSPLQP